MNAGTTSAIRIAVIGAGTISQSNHLPSLQRAGYDIVSVCDISPSRVAHAAARFGVPGTTSAAEVFANPEVEAVLIATPGSHTELVRAAIMSGKHVLTEKPLAMTIAEIDELEALAAAHGAVVQVGYMKMYDGLTDRARAELAELHDIRLIRITVSHPDDRPQTVHLRMAPPAGDGDAAEIRRADAYEHEQARVALGDAPPEIIGYYRSTLSGSVVHELSLLRALGLPLPTEWKAEVFPPLGGPSPSSLLATAAVGDIRYVISWNWLPEYPEYEEELKILASNGRLEYHLGKPYLLEERSRLRVERNDGLERRDTTYTQGFDSGFLLQLDAFADSVRRGAPVRSNLEGAKADIACLQAIAKAIAAELGVALTTETDRRAARALTDSVAH